VTQLVVDASALAGLVLPDEEGGDLPARLSAAAPVAPGLLWAEIRNLLLMAERRGRIDSGTVEAALGVIEDLGIALDHTPVSARTLTLARRHRLTIYDALYLELALRLGAPLATRDGALRRAALAEGVAAA
jgi:predicted nucleic acid-binding protein